jgi:small subunit ribosomal protein S19e
LESAGYITKKNKGRLMTDEGMKKIDRLATEIHNEIIKTSPELQRYA